MVYLIDTKTNELDIVDVNGIAATIIRHNFKLIEKKAAVFVVTDRQPVTWEACDIISFDKFRSTEKDIVLPGNKLYTNEDIDKFLN